MSPAEALRGATFDVQAVLAGEENARQRLLAARRKLEQMRALRRSVCRQGAAVNRLAETDVKFAELRVSRAELHATEWGIDPRTVEL